jgi:hypothetical protein
MRQSGYYWVRKLDDKEWEIMYYRDSWKKWLIGDGDSDDVYYEDHQLEIDETPITRQKPWPTDREIEEAYLEWARTPNDGINDDPWQAAINWLKSKL